MARTVKTTEQYAEDLGLVKVQYWWKDELVTAWFNPEFKEELEAALGVELTWFPTA